MRWIIRARQIIIWKRNGFNFWWTIHLTLAICSSVNFDGFWRWIIRLQCENGPEWWGNAKTYKRVAPKVHSFLQAWSTYWCNCFSLLDGILVHSVVTPGEVCRGAPTTVFYKISFWGRTYHLKQAHITCSGKAAPVLRFSGADVFVTGGCVHK